MLKHTVDVEATELRDIVRIYAGVQDEHSGVQSAVLKLKNNDTNTETVLLNNVTEDTVLNFNSTAYSNSDYSLVLIVTDHTGNTATKTISTPLDNRISAPILRTSPTSSVNAAIAWHYSQTMDRLASIEYSVDGGENWNAASIGENKQSGNFYVTLPQDADGSYEVIVRAVDTDGIKGKEKTISCRIDKTGPTVSIISLENGILKGSVSDENLEGWQILIKEKAAPDSSYTVIATGSDTVNESRIAIIDLSDSSYTANTTYTLKLKAIDILGNEAYTTYEYDAKDNVSKITDHLNNTITEYTYNYTGAGKGELASEKVYLKKDNITYLQRSISITYSYDSQDQMIVTRTEIADDKSAISVTTYDAAGKLISENVTYKQNGTSQGTKSVSYTYNGVGKLISQVTTETAPNTEQMQTSVTYTYDKNGNVTQEVNSNGTTHTYTYDAANNQISETLSREGQSKTWTTEYKYENVSIHAGIGAEETHQNAYVTTQRLTSGSDTAVLSKFYQDALGRTIRTVENRVQTDYTYDAQGNVKSTYQVGLNADGTEDASTAIHTLTLYDENGKQTVTIQKPVYSVDTNTFSIGSDTIVNTNEYDAKGNLISVTDGLGYTTNYIYDSNGQVTSVSLPDGIKTSFEYQVYDSSDNTTKTVTTYASGAVSELKYDATGAVVKITDKGNSAENLSPIEKSYTYDAKGNIVKETNSAGNYKTYEYDARERSVAVNYYDTSSSTQPAMRTEYEYNTSDMITAMKDYHNSDGSLTLYRYTGYTYDSFDRLTGKAEISTSTTPTSAELNAAMITYEYDINDNLIKINYPESVSAAAESLSYVYDSSTQKLISVSKTSGTGTEEIRSYTYYTDGKLHTAVSDGITESYTYDGFGRTLTKSYTVNGSTKEQHSYTYDKNSNIVAEVIVSSWNGNTNQLQKTVAYTYDSKGQLTQSVVSGTNAKTTLYEYDAVGNRTKETVGTTVKNYHYNSLNQLIEEEVNIAATADTAITYVYDANGNLIQKNNSKTGMAESYSYDAANQMTAYAVNENTALENLYNGNGQRIQKIVGSDTTNYFYDGDKLLHTTDGNGTLKVLQYYDPYGDLFANTSNDGTAVKQYYYTDDIRGSITNLVDTAKNSVVSYVYTDFGETTQSGSVDNEIRFSGGVYDAESVLYYLECKIL